MPTLTGPWVINPGLSVDDLREYLLHRRENGYRPTILSGYNDNGRERHVVLWMKGTSPEWKAMHGLSKDEYVSAVADFKSKDYVPVKICGYVIRKETKFTAIFEKKEGSSVITKVDMTSERFREAFSDFHDVGYQIVDFNAYSVDDTALFAAIWEKCNGVMGVSYVNNYSSSQLHEVCNVNYSEGYHMRTVSGYTLNGTDYFAALFEKDNTGRGQGANWGYSLEQYKHKIDNIIAQEFTPTFIHVFQSGSSIKFSLIWDK